MSASQKVVVVTGASQGIGADIVTAFRKLDYRVVATSRSIKPSEDPNILVVAGDIGDPATARRVISEGVAKFGRIDTLVNNAGIYIGKPFTENTTEDYAAVMNVNMAGFFYITQLAIAEMEKHSSGHVVSVTASVGDNAISGMYSVLAALTKGGVNSATKSLAIEYAKKGIRVNAVAPGAIQTDFSGGAVRDNPAVNKMVSAATALGRPGLPDDIGPMIASLLTEDNRWINAQRIEVSGGQSI